MRIQTLPLCLLIFFFFNSKNLFAQCNAGYTQASLNWDALAFLKEVYGVNVTTARAQNQHFAFGKNRLTLRHNYISTNVEGENMTHTGETGSYGSGSDLDFSGNGIITLSFQQAVQNVRFSLYDIDYAQRVTLSAFNAGTPVNINMTIVSGTNLTVTGTGTISANAKAGATNAISLTSSDGTVNINIPSTVDSVRMVITETGIKTTGPADSREDGRFWLSDISACTPSNPYTAAYRLVSQPFTNQPGYVLIADNTSVYQLDPATGRAKFLFSDPSNQNINSMGYDPYNKVLYFTNSLTTTATRALKKYDFNNNTLSVVTNDLMAMLNIPTFDAGVESGGASFYDNAFYIGIEGTGSTKSIIWRIDLDGSQNPISASQVFGIDVSGHDWGDFVVSNGTLYDFDGSASGGRDVYHLDLQTGAQTRFTGGFASISQTAVDWNGQIYNVGAAAVAPYNNSGDINSVLQQNITLNGTALNGSRGDAAEAFRPKADFGDAPASYDPDPMAPALHETIANLRLGNASDVEWNKIGSSATADDDTDDGMPYVQIISSGSTYVTDVNVFNNTGANATLAAWIDFNNDGIFDASEGISQTIGSSSSTQTINLFWSGITNNLPINSYTYIRIRITSATNGMTAANPTGFFADGEVEDYRVLVNSSILSGKFTSFSADKQPGNKVLLKWNLTNEEINNKYELQKSLDGKSWVSIHSLTAHENRANATYRFVDAKPHQPATYYRLVMVNQKGSPLYSDLKKVVFENEKAIMIFPNPAKDIIHIEMYSAISQMATIRISSINGKKMHDQKYKLDPGHNLLKIPVGHFLSSGIHHVEMIMGDETKTQAILIHLNK